MTPVLQREDKNFLLANITDIHSLQMQDIHKFYTWFYITYSFMTVSSSARYSQVLHMVFNYMFLQACVSKCKIFTSFTLGFLLHAPSGLCLQVQDIHKLYTWFTYNAGCV